MGAIYFGIHASRVRHVVQAARDLAEAGDLSRWQEFCDRVDAISMRPTLSLSPGILSFTGPSLLHVDDHAGLPPLDPAVVPAPDHPGLGWIIRTLLEQSSSLHARGRFDGLRGTLLDGVDRAMLLETQAETDVYDRFVNTIFDTPAILSPEQQFLAILDGFWSITGPAELSELLSEQNVGVLQTLVGRLLAAPHDSTAEIGRELQRAIHVCQLAMIDDLDLWTFELD